MFDSFNAHKNEQTIQAQCFFFSILLQGFSSCIGKMVLYLEITFLTLSIKSVNFQAIFDFLFP